MLGNSKTYTNRRESHEMEVTWPEQPRFTNAIAIVFYGMPVLVFLTCVIIMSQCSNLVSSGRYYMLSPPPNFKMRYIGLGRTGALLSNEPLIGAGRIFKKR